MIAFWALIISAIYALVRGANRPAERGNVDNARTILDERLARGEIDEDQYRATRELIRTGGPGPDGGGPR
jgi:putative membrane protein